MARLAILCRAARDQLLENAPRSVWPSSCNFRRVAALALPPSLLAQDVRASTPGAASRLIADPAPGAGDAAAGDGIFPEMLSGLVAANRAVAGDGGAVLSATPSNAAPHFDTPPGLATLLKGILAATRVEVADAVAPAAKRAPAARRTGSNEPSETPPKLAAGASQPAPDPVRLEVWQILAAIQLRPTLAIMAPPGNLPADPAPTSSAPSPAASQPADGQVPCAPRPVSPGPVSPGTIATVELPVKLGSPGPGVTAGVRPNGPTASLAAAQAVVVGVPAWPSGTARGGRPCYAPPALPAATGTDGAEVDRVPVNPLPATRVVEQPGAKLTILAENPSAGGIELPRRPAVPLPAADAVAQADARTSIAVAAPPPLAALAEPADEVPGVAPKPVGPMPAQPGTPPAARPRSGDPDSAVPPDEIVAGLPAPPPAAAGPSDFSGRLAGRTQVAAPPSRKTSGSVMAQVLALSGQVARTVDSIPPEAPAPSWVPAYRPADGPLAASRPALEPPSQAMPAEVEPGNPAESLIPGANTQIRVLGTATPDRDEVAFALQVKPLPTPEGTRQAASPGEVAAAVGSERSPVAAQPGGVPVPDPAAAGDNRPSLRDEPDHTPARAGRERHPDAAPPERPAPPAGAQAGKMNPQASPDAQVRTETAAERQPAAEAPLAKPVRPQDVQEAMDGASKPIALKAAGVRDMKFEVTGGQQRVEVRLSERAGEVKMTVRTADEPLANTLRENLPALNARLAESGLRSEAWHPPASSSESRHTTESAARGASRDASQDADAQPRQQDREPPDGAAQRRPRSPQEVAPQKEKGKDFAWLISSLR